MHIREVAHFSSGHEYVRSGAFSKNALAFVSEVGMHENSLIICNIDENMNISFWKEHRGGYRLFEFNEKGNLIALRRNFYNAQDELLEPE